MCGICGYIGKKAITDEELLEMNNTMLHRGPNDGGIWKGKMSDGYSVGLAQRRLSIVDLTQRGHQPMTSKDGKYVIVFNGEIYNYREIGENLKKKGYFLESNCDTEVILSAYIEYGEKCISMFNGMFAFAIFDMIKNQIVFARDRIGKKPLYYYFDKENLIFGSELKPILKNKQFRKSLRTDLILRYLCNQYINGPETIFENTFKLLPGTYLIYKNQHIEKKVYWNLYDTYLKASNNKILNYEEAKYELSKVLEDAIQKRMIADVPVGVFLSGGVDSSLIASLAQKNSTKPIKTFSIGFFEKERNEADRAKKIAEYLGTEHSELYISENDMLESIEEMVKYYDEPFADPSQLPMMILSKMAKRDVTVALSGDGGDELFCGYEMYDYIYMAQRLDRVAGIVDNIMRTVHLEQIKNSSFFPKEAKALLNNRDENTKVQLFTDLPEEYAKRMVRGCSKKAKYDIEKEIQINNWQERRMILDMLSYLPEDILTKTDRASMRYSLEVRCPILDYNLVECAFRIPHWYKYNKANKKYILKDLLYENVPTKLFDTKKRGFGVPLGKWLRMYLKDDILALSDRKAIERQGIFNYEEVQQLIAIVSKTDHKPYPKLLWAYYVFQLWYNEYIDGLKN